MTLETELKTPEQLADYLEETMVLIEGGSFEMGSEEYHDEKPVHTVTLDSFYLCKYPVTQALYQAVTGKNPSSFSHNPQNPVEYVSWYDAVAFCNLLSLATNLSPVYTIDGEVEKRDIEKYKNYEVTRDPNANGYGLPSEAEWEYAARGGKQQESTTYSGSNDLSEVGWFRSNSHKETKPVGIKLPNALGMHDMSGNVWEWCFDWYTEYRAEPQHNPIYAEGGTFRVLRGGSWRVGPLVARVANRYRRGPGGRLDGGFRLHRAVL